jgi:hypothetical protein
MPQGNKKGLDGFSPFKAVSSQIPAFQGQGGIIMPMIVSMLVRVIFMPLVLLLTGFSTRDFGYCQGQLYLQFCRRGLFLTDAAIANKVIFNNRTVYKSRQRYCYVQR